MAATAGSGCGEVGMKFSKQELLKFFEHQQIPSRTQKFSMLIGSKLDRVNRPLDCFPYNHEITDFTVYNVCSVHRGMFSTLGGVQYIGGDIMSTSE